MSNDSVLFRPTEHLLDLRRGDPATQKLGYSITYIGVDLDSGADKSLTIEVRRGKNANIAINRIGDDDLAAVLADPDTPFSILTPGLSGIPMREEWRTKGAMDAAVMHGDANLYLRTVLDHLFTRDLDEMASAAWIHNRDIGVLPESRWKTFCTLLNRCYPGARVIVAHDPRRDRYGRSAALPPSDMQGTRSTGWQRQVALARKRVSGIRARWRRSRCTRYSPVPRGDDLGRIDIQDSQTA